VSLRHNFIISDRENFYTKGDIKSNIQIPEVKNTIDTIKLIQQEERLIMKRRKIIKLKLPIGFSQIINSKIVDILSSESHIKIQSETQGTVRW
jgi:hypothetical protein